MRTPRSIHLHARQIEFMHPVKDEKIVIIASVPDEVIWKFFEDKMSY
jgi:23S rRNA pseudouridine1911/1915/1917 synthase